MKKIILLTFLFSASLWSQTAVLTPQDQGMTLEHPTCRLLFKVSNQGWVRTYSKKFEKKKIIKILREKGYRTLNALVYIDSKNYRTMDVKESDLVFKVSHTNQGIKAVLEEKGHWVTYKVLSKDQPSNYSLANSLKELPNCVTNPLAASNLELYEKAIREYELSMCSNLFHQAYSSFQHRSLIEIVGSRIGKVGWTIIPLLINPSSTIAVVATVLGVGLSYGLFAESAVQREKSFQDGILIAREILDCEEAKRKGYNCSTSTLLNSLSKRGSKRVRRYLKRMSFEEFSEKMTNYIVQNQACSNPSYKIKNYKKLLKKARKSF